MTLEEFSKKFPVRCILGTFAIAINFISLICPQFPIWLAKKMKALLSIRLNNLLFEQLYVYSRIAPKLRISTNHIFCNTGLDINLQLNLCDYTQGSFYFNGLPDFFLDLVAFSNERTAFFDLGSNMGIISAGLSKFIPPDNIVAVESMPDTFLRLQQVFNDNCPNASAFNMALSSGRGTLKFHIPSSDSGSSSASLTPDELISTRRPNIEVRTLDVACDTFDNFYQELNLKRPFSSLERHAFKIDVEGHEIQVIQGMKNYFSEYKGAVLLIVEVRPNTRDAVNENLSGHGFIRVCKDCHDSSDLPLRDFIYMRKVDI
jgi:FkbM family methyltransferase